MRFASRKLAGFAVAVVLASASLLIAAEKQSRKQAPQIDESRRALHALNRLTFGARPGEVERVTALGLDKWIEQQLHPEKIDDSALEARLSPFRTLKMSAREMAEDFPPPQVIRQMERRGGSPPRDPEKRAIYEAMMSRYEERQKNQQNAQANPPQNGANNAAQQADQQAANSDPNMMDDDARRQRREQMRQARSDAQPVLDRLQSETPDQRYQEILRMNDSQRRAVLSTLTPDERRSLGHNAVSVLATIHSVDVDDIGLGDLGPREDFLGRQIRRTVRNWAAWGEGSEEAMIR